MKFRTARFSLMTVAAAVALSTSPAWAQLKMGFNVPLTGFAAADGKSALEGAKLAEGDLERLLLRLLGDLA